MDPFTINRLGQIRHQEIVDWAAQNNQQPLFRGGGLRRVFISIRQKLSNFAPQSKPTESECPPVYKQERAR